MSNAADLLAKFANLPIGSGVSDWRTPESEALRQESYNQVAAGELEQPYTPQIVDSNPLTATMNNTIGRSRYNADRNAFRTEGQKATDTLISVGSGLTGTLGGLGSLGVGLVSDRGGAWVAQQSTDFAENLREEQSGGLNAKRQANAARSTVSQLIDDAAYENDRRTRGKFVSGLRKVGREFISGVSNAAEDPAIFADGAANAVGSLLIAGPLGKGAKVVGSGVLSQLLKRGVIAEAAAVKAAQFGSKAAMPLTIGAMESSGVYQQTVQQVMDMGHEDLLKTSPDYAELIKQKWDPADAKIEIATSAGLTAAAIQFPVAVAAGALVSKFEGNPFKGASSVVKVARNSSKEALEEGIQSGSGQFTQNVGIQAFANADQNLADGVGEQAALGALYGATSAGLVQIPGGVTNASIAGTKAAIDGVKSLGKGLIQSVNGRIAAINAAAEASSPVSKEAVSATIKEALLRETELNTQVQNDIASGVYTPEQGQTVLDRMGKLYQTMRMDPTELDDLPIDENLKSMIGSAEDRFDALNLAAGVAGDVTQKPESRIGAAIFINDTLERFGSQIVGDLVSAMDPLPEQNPLTDTLRGYEGVLVAMQSNPALIEARGVAQKFVEQLKAENISADTIETPRGQTAAKAVASVAQSNPESVPAELAGLVLEQYRLGKVKLSVDQANSLESVGTISRAGETYKLRAKKLDLPEKKLSLTDIVSGQITNSGTDNPDGTRSAAGHVKYVIQALNAGNTALAADRLNRMMAFSQHMQNKMAALNQSYQSGTASKTNLTKYQALSPSGAFQESLTGVWLNPKAGPSVALAQRISLDAEILGTMANELALAYPALGVNPIELASLPAELEGPSEVVARRFRKGLTTVEPTETEPSTLQAEPAPVAEPTPTITPVEPVATEPVKVDLVVEAKPSTPVKTESKAPEAVTEPTKPEPKVAEPETKPVEQTEEKSQAPAEISTTQRETEPTPEPEAASVPEVQPEVTEPKTVAEAFPNLHSSENGKVKNWFHKAFKLSKQIRSRLLGTGSPAKAIFDALKSQKALNAFRGTNSTRSLSSSLVDDYLSYLGYGNLIADSLKARLAEALAAPLSKGNPTTFADALAEGMDGDSQVNGWRSGKPFNITERDADGNFTYNDELLEGAILAGLQWAISAQSRNTVYDAESVAKLLKTDEATAAQYVDWFNTGMWQEAAKRDLSDMIPKFWGLQSDRNAPEGYVKGISESMAAEVINGMIDAGLLARETEDILGKTYTKVMFDPKKTEVFKSLNTYPSVIEEAALVEPEGINHIGKAPEKVPTNQLHGSPVKLKPKQVELITNAQNTPYRLNLSMLRFVGLLGEAGMEGLFGRGSKTGKNTNENTAKSIEGYNRTITSAFSNLMALVSEMDNYANTNDVELADVDMFFEFGISSVGRLQMQGTATPQASKVVREVLLPTWSTLDLSKTSGPHYEAFMLAIAQHLGIKVHKKKLADSIAEVEKQLEGKFFLLMDTLNEWDSQYEDTPIELTEADFKPFKDVFGDKISPAAIHSLVEYNRYQKATPEQRAAFKTGLYLEADGVTDGPINALVNFVAGSFTPSWIDLLNRGGLYLGSTHTSLADYIARKESPFGNGTVKTDEDLYQLTTNFFQETLASLKAMLSTEKPAYQKLNQALTDVLADLLPDMTYDSATGVLKFDRGIAKSPLTVTVYGSSVGGIANKITAIALEEMYSRYPTLEDMPPALRENIDFLTSFVMNTVKGEFKMFGKRDETNYDTKGGLSYTFTPSMIKNLEGNIRTLFAAPLQEAISEVMGDAMKTATVIRQATQSQSIFFKYAYREALADVLKQKDGTDGTLSRDFLSAKELEDIFQGLVKRFPMIETEAQTIWVGGSARAEVEASEFGRDIKDKMGSEPYIFGPANAGVAGIPFIVIGTGDGQMIINALTGETPPQGTLPVFDGINMKLDTIMEDSVKINKAVYDGWMQNPVRAVEQSFRKFLEAGGIEQSKQAMSEEMIAELERAFGSDLQDFGVELQNTYDRLAEIANSLDARKAVLAKVNMSVDHMASAGSPYVRSDGVELPVDPVAAAAVMDTMYQEELAKIPGTKPLNVYEAPSEDITRFLGSNSDLHSSGARVISREKLRTLVDALNIPLDQKSLVRAAANSLATKDWTVIHGSAEQLQIYANQEGIRMPEGWEANDGFVLPGTKTLFMLAATSEVLAHELIHAATVEQIYAHYKTKAGAFQTKEELTRSEAVRRMEVLMDEFMGIEPNSITDEKTRDEFMFAKAAIEAIEEKISMSPALKNTAKLNEFMAWTLANQKLADLARSTKVRSSLGLIVSKVLATLRKLWRAGLAPSAQDDVYSNLRFNTLLLMNAKPSKLANTRDLSSMAQFQNRSYGGSDRLQRIEQGFLRGISAVVRRAEQDDRVLAQDLMDQHADMMVVAGNIRNSAIASGFNMTAQAASLFEVLVTALAVDSTLDGNGTARLNDMYQHVITKLDPKDFRRDPDTNDDADQKQAQDKYDFVVGNAFVIRDLKGRSSLLAAFLALAAVNEEFQAVLEKMAVPKSEATSDGTLDSILSSKVENALDLFARKLSGEGTNSPNIQSAVAAIIGKLSQNQAEREDFITQFVNPAGDRVDGVNDWLVRNSQELSQRGADYLSQVADDTDNKYVKAAAKAGEAIMGVVNKDISEGLSLAAVSTLNKGNAWTPFREIVSEVIGRTKENAPIYDMIKMVRAFSQKLRETYRDQIPKLLAEKFTRKLNDAERTALYTGFAKTDLAVFGSANTARVLEMVRDNTKLTAEIARLNAEITRLDPTHAALIQRKSAELADYMINHKVSDFLLRNAEAIAGLYQVIPDGMRRRRGPPSQKLIDAIDQLTSLNAFKLIPNKDRIALSELASRETAGTSFVFGSLVAQHGLEREKSFTDRGRLNHYKGHVPTETKAGSSLVVSKDDPTTHADLLRRGYVRVARYNGSRAERYMGSKSYYFAPLTGKSAFNQGIAQNIRQTFNGVDPVTGFTLDTHGVGRIVQTEAVRAITASRGSNNKGQPEALMPVFDGDGSIIAYERSMDPAQLQRLERESDLLKVIGIWRGRQSEERAAIEVNKELVGRLYDIWTNRGVGREDEFVNLLDMTSHKDRVVADAVKLLTPEMLEEIKQSFAGEGFMVRKDMINDAIGYRSASVGDLWTGVTRIPPETAKVAANIATAVVGAKAYQYLVTGEKLLQNFVGDAKNTIVIRSIVVPVANIVSNIYQLASRGVPLNDIVRGMPKKLVEVRTYHANRLLELRLENEILVNKDSPSKLIPLRTKLQSIRDSHKRLSIWPLIEAGEFSSVSEATVSREDSTLLEGKMSEYVETLVDKLPVSVRTAGRYAIVSRDTALYQGLQRTVEYGDFLAKAILYDELTIRKKQSSKEALVAVSDEFVNYDRLPGRFRGALESNGLIWFWHFKLRAAKIAVSMVRNNPLHVLLAGLVPTPDFIGSIGSPLGDNAFSIALEGKSGYSIGPMMGVHAQALNPWGNLLGF